MGLRFGGLIADPSTLSTKALELLRMNEIDYKEFVTKLKSELGPDFMNLNDPEEVCARTIMAQRTAQVQRLKKSYIKRLKKAQANGKPLAKVRPPKPGKLAEPRLPVQEPIDLMPVYFVLVNRSLALNLHFDQHYPRVEFKLTTEYRANDDLPLALYVKPDLKKVFKVKRSNPDMIVKMACNAIKAAWKIYAPKT